MNNFIAFIGWLGTILFALSALPQTVSTIKEGNAKGLNILTLFSWYIGEILMLIYALYYYSNDYVLLVNYTFNIILLSIIVKYKLFPRK